MAKGRAAKPDGAAADPYETLGLARSATEAEIRKAYRKLVRLSHPDINPDDPGAEARFVAVSAAYDLLKDPARRARFDAGEIDAAGQERPQRRYYRDYAGPGGQGAREQGPRDPGSRRSGFDRSGFRDEGAGRDAGGFGDMDADAIFAEMFRQRAAGGGGGFAVPGRDIGLSRSRCRSSTRRGAARRASPCPERGPSTSPSPRACATGRPCGCAARGARASGGGPRGDAQVTVTVRPHPVFRREGDDIHVTLPVTIDEAVLGAKVDVPTIHGDVAMRVPEGSSGGRILRLRGRGVKGANGAGDQLVELRIVLPDGGRPRPRGLHADLARGTDRRPARRHAQGGGAMTGGRAGAVMFTRDEVLGRVVRLTRTRLAAYVEAEAVVPEEGEAGPVFAQADVARLDLLCELAEAFDMAPDALRRGDDADRAAARGAARPRGAAGCGPRRAGGGARTRIAATLAGMAAEPARRVAEARGSPSPVLPDAAAPVPPAAPRFRRPPSSPPSCLMPPLPSRRPPPSPVPPTPAVPRAAGRRSCTCPARPGAVSRPRAGPGRAAGSPPAARAWPPPAGRRTAPRSRDPPRCVPPPSP